MSILKLLNVYQIEPIFVMSRDSESESNGARILPTKGTNYLGKEKYSIHGLQSLLYTL
jgi:hypothetical protein